MTTRDRLWISLRHMKSGTVGVLLVVLATAVGIALAASTSAFVRAYGEQTRRLLNHPVYREVLVEVPSFGETELSTPVVEIELAESKSGFLSMEDMIAAAESAPAVEYAYVLERQSIMTTAALMRLYGEKAGDRIEKAELEKKGLSLPEEDDVLVELPVEDFPGIRTSADFFAAYELAAAEGTLFSREDLDAGNPVIVLGSELAETLFPEGGAVGSRASLDFQTYTAIGVLEPTPLADPGDLMPYDRMAFLPQQALEKVWNKRVPITSMRFTAKSSSNTRAAVRQLTAYFESAHPEANVMITDSVQELQEERQTLSRVIAVLVFLSGVGLLIAAINLLNLMLIRIIKHTRGIGIMRALGSTRRDVFRQFMSEALLMCGVGAVIGAAVSPLVYGLLQTATIAGPGFASRTFALDLIVGAAAGLLFSLAFGMYPAVLAKNTDASLAIRAE